MTFDDLNELHAVAEELVERGLPMKPMRDSGFQSSMPQEHDEYLPQIIVFRRDEFWVARVSITYLTDDNRPYIQSTSACESRDYQRAISYALSELAVLLERGELK